MKLLVNRHINNYARIRDTLAEHRIRYNGGNHTIIERDIGTREYVSLTGVDLTRSLENSVVSRVHGFPRRSETFAILEVSWSTSGTPSLREITDPTEAHAVYAVVSQG